MPFHQRTVEPARLRRPEAAEAGAAGAPLFRSLEQVSSHALVCLLAQLADLSRCAGDIFGELEGQAAALGHRTAELHRRLDALHAAAARLDHRRVKIREWPAGRGRGTRREVRPDAPGRPLAARVRRSGRRVSLEPLDRRVLGWGLLTPEGGSAGGRRVWRPTVLGFREIPSYLAGMGAEWGNWAVFASLSGRLSEREKSRGCCRQRSSRGKSVRGR